MARKNRRSTEELPLFVLGDDWTGDRHLTGISMKGDQVVAETVLHGSLVDDQGPRVLVETSRPITGYGGDSLRVVAEYVWRRTDGWSWLPDLDEDDRRLLDRVRSTTAEAPIDGERTLFRVVEDGNEWIARTRHGGFNITVQSRGLPLDELRLFRLGDRGSVEPFPPVGPSHGNWVEPFS
jgi:hypothetical protein